MADRDRAWYRPMTTLLRVLFAALLLLATAPCPPAFADTGPGLVRDAEIETDIRNWVDPIFTAAGLDSKFVQIYLVNDPQINSFVAGGQRVFINTGLLMRSTTPNEVIGVLAHETGHIAGGHLVREQEALSQATVASIIGYVLGAASAVLAHDGSGIAMGAMAGQSMAERQLFAYSINQEERADQAALGFLDATHQSARGLLQLFEVLQKEEFLLPGSQDPYLRTHPLTQSRIDHMREHVDHSPYANAKDPPEFIDQHARIVAKLVGFLSAPDQVLKRYPPSDQSLAARYARAIAYHRIPQDDKAQAEMDSLLRQYPNDPYFNELKGQIYFEGGHVSAAIGPYRKAVQLAPDSALLKTELGKALIELGDDPTTAKEAEGYLKESVRQDDSDPDAWNSLGIAQGYAGQTGDAEVSLAEAAMLEGRPKTAAMHARHAEDVLPRGSPGWLKADDIAQEVKADREKTD